MTSIADETTDGLANVVVLVRRWWLVLLVGTVFGLAVAAVVVVGSTTRYEAESVVLVDQPEASLDPQVGKDTVEKIVQLLPTISQLAVSDELLEEVGSSLGLDQATSELRDDVSVTPLPDSLSLRIRVRADDTDEARAVSEALIDGLEGQLTRLGTGTDASELVTTTIQAPTVDELGQNAPRTLILAALIGFGLALVVALALDRS